MFVHVFGVFLLYGVSDLNKNKNPCLFYRKGKSRQNMLSRRLISIYTQHTIS